jgi:regulator of protease activity HflC (stomatin/prohibitin superfamily)
LKVTDEQMTVIPQGKVGVLIAQDGRELKEGAVLAADDDIDPQTGKLIKMGEKGIRKSILAPGTYPINTKYFTVELHDALNIEPGKVGVLTRKIGDQAPTGQILVPRESNYRGIIREILEPGIQYLHPYVYKWEIVDAITIPAGKVGVLTRKVGDLPPPGSILVDRNSQYQGIIKEVLEPGLYYKESNPYEFAVEIHDAINIPDGFVGVMIAKTGQSAPGDQLLVDEGYRGVRKQYLKPGLYYINPYEFDIVPVETRKQKYEMTYVKNEGDTAFADEITFLSNDGFPISIDVTVLYEITPENAPYVVATLGKNLEDIKTKIIRPGSRSFARLEGSMLKAVEFVTGETRKTFQDKLAQSLQAEGAKAQINIINTFVRGYTIPEELLAPIRMKEIAEKQKEQIIEEQKREEEQAQLARQKALVEQQSQKVNAETAKIVAETKAQQEKEVAIIKGEQILEVAKLEREAAEQEKLRQIALGEGEAKRRELLIKADNLEELRLNIYKEVMTRFASEIGKQKWVPDMVVGGQATAGGGNLANSISDILNMLNLMVANQLRTRMDTPPENVQAPKGQP